MRMGSEPVEGLARRLEDGADFLDLRRGEHAAAQLLAQRRAEGMDVLAYGGATQIPGGLLELAVDAVELVAIVVEIGAAGIGDGVDALGSTGRGDDEISLL